jgi:hypothetical protein
MVDDDKKKRRKDLFLFLCFFAHFKNHLFCVNTTNTQYGGSSACISSKSCHGDWWNGLGWQRVAACFENQVRS